MTSTRGILATVVVLAGSLWPTHSAQAGPEAPCLELRLGGESVVRLPCPEGLSEVLELPLFRPPPDDRDDFAIVPELPDDRYMAIDPAWPHDGGMIADPDGARPPARTRFTPAPPRP
ncbi:MAG: hypothetical protein JSU82_08230 [Rhodospirillales bacterium]|nr:MAG: hypothetical protein JSU82_08230 [Rhodospirillales bacterium]